ncbi:MAG: nucleotidyltransferase domain-containing protein, partial [Lachnospiraceae bacterium]|nr:nucleotidyltransferase domain-containing protein [Lachnospiraceae bacterium]
MIHSIEKMINEIVSILDGGVYGIWLYGSVVMDDFCPGWSDIDFVALTDGSVSESQAEKLLRLRQ